MTTNEAVLDAFGPAPAPKAILVPAPAVAGPRPSRSASAGPRAARWSAVTARLVAFTRTAAADLRGAWWWRGVPPTLAQLWAARVPDRGRVPGGNAVLWVSWAAYNHLYLAVSAPLYVLFFALAHPARFVLAAALAAGLFFVWT